MTATKAAIRGFGYQPERSRGYHFEVRQAASGDVTMLERYAPAGDFTSGEDGSRPTIPPREQARLTAHRWGLVQATVAGDFNQRLIGAKLRPGKWLKGVTPLAPHFGKELILLAWAIDDQDPTSIPRMLANWRGLAPEERWWFYTTINAAGHLHAGDRPYGWRAAIKIAFLEDPRDIGLESLRITGESPLPAPEPATEPLAALDGAVLGTDGSLPKQGRLFAEPDAPDYRT